MSPYLAILLASLACAGCASQSSTCSLDKFVKPPKEAEIVRTHGFDLAVYPVKLDERFSGCQHYWIGDGDRPAQMSKTMAMTFVDGQVTSLAVREPKKPQYHCAYAGGVLVESQSQNARYCPDAKEFKLSPYAPLSESRTPD